ncbi:Late embryogenesis abundant (LEA) hydroxyproline-rich glycoprotein family [Euphorbia peplus]|nr:Late embryogenesis abundant (LEA) hydroxyproline-rich glycoprotein family [Euphorbia peplus]
MGLTINNKNYGGFKYENTTAYVNYEDIVVGEVPIPADTVEARKKHDVDMSITIFADKLLLGNQNFSRDFFAGMINLTASSTMIGKVILFNNLIKVKAVSDIRCDISLHILPSKVDSVCQSKVTF